MSMKIYLVILMLTTSWVLQAAESSINLLAIYLVDARIFPDWPTNSIDQLKVISPPVIADSDFVSFDTISHKFVIKPDAAKRLSQSIWELGKKDAPNWGDVPTILPGGVHELIPVPVPFVIKASGQPIYAGAFWTPISSSSYYGPTIHAATFAIRTNLTKNVEFSIEPGSSRVTDLRGDSKIALAAEKLFAHEKK